MISTLTNWLTDNLGLVSLALSVAILFVVCLLLILFFQLRKLSKKHKSLMTGAQGINLEQLLEDYLSKVRIAETKVDDLNQRCENLEQYAQKSLQNVALLRFNAFENMGSDLSFAVALLDMNGDGVVLSSINSRDESRVYAKPIKDGQSNYHLSDEEIAAIKKAITGSKSK